MSKIKVGIWGLGRAGWNMHCNELDRFRDDFEVVAGCDYDAARAKDIETRYPGAKGYSDAGAFLQDPNIELVSVVTYSPDHGECAKQALAAGKFVFLEKPIALNYHDAKKLLKLERKYPGKLFIRHNRRFEAAFNHIREIIASGILGDVFEIKLCRHRYQSRNDWQTLIHCGGGQLNNWGPHLLDHALRFLDSPVAEVWSNLKKVATLGDAEDHIKIILTGQNGRVVDVEISDGVLIPSPVYAAYGTRGTLVSTDEKILQLKYLDPAQNLPSGQSHEGSPARDGGYGQEFKLNWVEENIPVNPANHADMEDIYGRVYQAIRENVPYPIKLSEAVETVRVTELIKKHSAFVKPVIKPPRESKIK